MLSIRRGNRGFTLLEILAVITRSGPAATLGSSQ
jgi:type II secretory pathway pseudopilin PulG